MMERETLMTKATKAIVILLLFSLFTFQFTALADSSSDKSINISLTLDDGNITVNGEKLTVEPPYLTSDNSTLVPLRVITTAFGAVVTWDSATQTVGLKYNNHTISVTIDSKQAIVDGKSIDMTTAPQLHNATTMVPLRFISENFGAKLNFNKDTKQITIVGSGASTDSTQTSLNTDAGKTKIGDSYYNWSMKYPTGLVKSYQAYKGNSVYFKDANGEYDLNISIEPSDVQNLSIDGLLLKLTDNVEGAILSKGTIKDKADPYADVVSKNDDGSYNESRAYFSNGNIFIISMDVLKEINFTNPIKHAGYTELLDSFTLSFNTKDVTIKDLSTIKDGFRKYTNDDYGFSLNIPADWDKGIEASSNFSFSSDKITKQNYYIYVSSVAKGETFDSWLKQNQGDFMDTLVEAYRTIGASQSITVGGLPAIEFISGENSRGTWVTDDNFFIINGNLKYHIDFEYPKNAPAADIQAKKDQLIKSFTFTNKINPTLGNIADSHTNKNNKSKIINKNIELSFELPEFWKDSTTYSQKATGIFYTFPGGGFTIMTSDKSKADVANLMEEQLKAKANIQNLTATNVTVAGLSAKKIVYTSMDSGAQGTGTVYVFSSSTKDYFVIYGIGDAFDTTSTQQRIEDLINSIQLTS